MPKVVQITHAMNEHDDVLHALLSDGSIWSFRQKFENGRWVADWRQELDGAGPPWKAAAIKPSVDRAGGYAPEDYI